MKSQLLSCTDSSAVSHIRNAFPVLTDSDVRQLQSMVSLTDNLIAPISKIGVWMMSNPQLANVIIDDHQRHQSTKWHREPLLVHLLATGIHSYQYALATALDPIDAFYAGFFHDIGKPFARVDRKKYTFYTGHASLGAHLLETTLKKVDSERAWNDIAWVCNHHMCSCTSEQSAALVSLSQPSDNAIQLLSVVRLADQTSRISDQVEVEVPPFTLPSVEDAITTLCHTKHMTNSSIIVVMLGPSGSGKSTMTEYLKTVCHQHSWSVISVERDQSLETVHRHLFSKTAAHTVMYEATGQYTCPLSGKSGRQFVQEQWIQDLSDALETLTQVIIIDSVQPLFMPWKTTLESLSEDAQYRWMQTLKVGYYAFPQHWLGVSYTPKTGEYAMYPLTGSTVCFPSLLMEVGKSDGTMTMLDYGTGQKGGLVMVMQSWLNGMSSTQSQQIQENLLTLIRQQKSNDPFQDVINLFPNHIVYHQEELCGCDGAMEYSLHKLLYKDGMQIFTGPTRDYRGDAILECRDSKTSQSTFHYFRASMPVFPDFTSLGKDPLAQTLIDSDSVEFAAIPKYDGSMFNLIFVPNSASIIPGVIALTRVAPPQSWTATDLGYWIFGSKNTCFYKHPVMTRIQKAIRGSYGTLGHFITAVSTLIIENQLQDTLSTLHFEAIDEMATDELTVYYGYNQCPFLGVTSYDGHEKQFILPSNLKTESLSSVSPVSTFKTWSEFLNYSDTTYQQFLNGDLTIEPEGFVVHIIKNGRWVNAIKYKFPIYYVAHKPHALRNTQEAESIRLDSKYTSIRERFLKFRTQEKPPLDTLLHDAFEEIRQWGAQCRDTYPSAKECAMALNQPESKTRIQGLASGMTDLLAKYYPSIKSQLPIFTAIMKIHREKQSMSDDQLLSLFRIST